MIDAFRRRVVAAKDQLQFQLNARAFALFDDRDRFLDALAVADAAKEEIESPLERLRSMAQAACTA
jgi:hypothetical protein